MRISGNNPDELIRLGVTLGGGSGEGDDDAETGDETPEPSAAAPAAATAEPAPEPQPAVAPAEEWSDIREFAKSNGVDLSHIPDSEQAARYLVDMARNNSAYAQYGQQLAPYYSEFQQFLAQRQTGGQARPQTQAPPTPEQAKRYFNLPEYDPSWLDWLERDAAGNIVPKVGAPPDIVGKVTQYHKALQGFQTNFWQKPQDYLNPLIQDAVTPLVQKAIQQNLQQYQDQIFATNFLAQHTNWMHYHDQQGQVLRDPVSGGYAMTPEGQLFVNHVKRAEQMGMTNMQVQQQYAMDMMKLAYLSQQQTQQQGVQTAEQKNQQLLQQRNRRAPNSSGSLNGGPQVSQNTQASLADRLRSALTGNGINDAALIADVR